jgi:hypothetical protein
MIHPDLLKAVVDTLDSHRYLSHEDFILAEYENHEKEPCLSIKYRYQSNLFFNFSLLTEETRRPQHGGIEVYRFGCTIRPGRETVEEERSIEERSGLIQELQDGCDCHRPASRCLRLRQIQITREFAIRGTLCDLALKRLQRAIRRQMRVTASRDGAGDEAATEIEEPGQEAGLSQE